MSNTTQSFLKNKTLFFILFTNISKSLYIFQFEHDLNNFLPIFFIKLILAILLYQVELTITCIEEVKVDLWIEIDFSLVTFMA